MYTTSEVFRILGSTTNTATPPTIFTTGFATVATIKSPPHPCFCLSDPPPNEYEPSLTLVLLLHFMTSYSNGCTYFRLTKKSFLKFILRIELLTMNINLTNSLAFLEPRVKGQISHLTPSWPHPNVMIDNLHFFSFHAMHNIFKFSLTSLLTFCLIIIQASYRRNFKELFKLGYPSNFDIICGFHNEQ